MAGALCAVLATPAQAQPAAGSTAAMLGAGVSFVPSDGVTFKGFGVNFSKDITSSGNWGLGPVGEFTLHSGADVTVTTFTGGIRATGNMPDARFLPFVQFQIGFARASNGGSANGLGYLFGGGVHVPLNETWNFMAGIDLVTLRFNGVSGTDPRFMFGVSTKVGG